MSAPVPAPRFISTETKKPIPTPRRSVVRQKSNESSSSKSSDEQLTNTFSRKVRSISNASKQIAEDIGEIVHDRKRAVIKGTRQSVRRITRRFSSSPQEPVSDEINKNQSDIDDTIDIFNSISFQSPISSLSYDQNIYNNVDRNSSGSDEFVSLPPPSHPPPSLPVDCLYDAPNSIASSSTSNSDLNVPAYKPENYESIFPVQNYNNNETNSFSLATNNEVNKQSVVDLSRSDSWKFYDSVTKTENIYNDIDNNPLNKDKASSKNGSSNSTNETDLNSNLSMISSVDVRNSLYENHVIINQKGAENKKKTTESVLFQFDPLKNSVTANDNATATATNSNDLQMLEKLFQEDLYGSLSAVYTLDDWSISNDSEPDDFVNPPSPPVRVDSLPEEEQSQPTTPKEKSRSNWFFDSANKPNSNFEIKKISWIKQVKEVLEKAPDVVRGVRNKDAVVDRPEISLKNFVYKKGMLYKVQNGPVEDLFGEYSGRWCILEKSSFICYSDNSCDTIKENFPAATVLSIQILQDSKYKYKYDNDDLHCFELNTTGKSRGGHIYGTRDIAERRIWMQNLAESLTKRFSTKITTDYTRMGWAYLREGVSGKWVGAWLILSHRTLYYAIDNQSIKSTDLRKARCIVLQVYQESDNNPRTNDRGPNMVVDTPSVALYLRMWTSRETKVWCHIVKLAAHNNGANLDQQQLTKNDVPVIVEKCINFVYAHGSMTEGIYRRPGVGSAVTDILTKFRKDAWAVQLTIDKYTEHDVATALKRFFRDLPESLLSNGSNRQYFYQVSMVKNIEERVRMYKAALDNLSPISYKCTKKLLGHLNFISTQYMKNLMTVENLASIWGPTLMHYEDKDANIASNSHHQDSIVVGQLINLYRSIFPEDPGELEQEKIMLQVLQRYTNSPQGAVNNKKAGDFRMWIYVYNKEGQTFNVAIGPNKTAYDVCVELCSKINVPVNELIIEEVVLSDRLTRPIHHTEKVLDVVLRWGYWDEPDRKDNHLILTRINKYFDFIQEKHLPVASGELKFADSKSKNFKIFMFEFSQAKLNCFKDRSCETKLFTWNIEDIVWYLGNESKRNPQSKWTITFIETKIHPKRTKSSPFFGNIIAWNDPTTRASWLATMLQSRYSDSLTPPPMHVNIFS